MAARKTKSKRQSASKSAITRAINAARRAQREREESAPPAVAQSLSPTSNQPR